MIKSYQVDKQAAGPVTALTNSFSVSPKVPTRIVGLLSQSRTQGPALGDDQLILDTTLFISVPFASGTINERFTDSVVLGAGSQDLPTDLLFLFGRGQAVIPIELILDVGYVYSFSSGTFTNALAGSYIQNRITLLYDNDFGRVNVQGF